MGKSITPAEQRFEMNNRFQNLFKMLSESIKAGVMKSWKMRRTK